MTQQIFAFGRPHVLCASHLSKGFLQVPGSVPSFTAPFTTVLAHFTYPPWDLAALQSHAADTTARMLSIAARSVQVLLLQAAPAGPEGQNEP